MRKLLVIACVTTACGGGSTKPSPPIANQGGASASQPAAPPDAVVVRACNDTTYDFTGFQYADYDAPSVSLPAGTCTGWTVVPAEQNAYSYTYAKFSVSAATFIIQPIDYVGETPLGAGHWSYGVTIIDFQRQRADIRARREP